ncbi:methyltransferase domain-containing protein [Jonesiaceae bacterium BS-20]|uniref:Methyltransferase domain-containing protein n=1 Tax=Jonesiaceae bacterium BS-20 TaxID=3120821 RepID=A0AAU7DU22_9MICO
MDQSFYDQIELGLSADITGWDFAWLDGHATEERPPWGYANLLGERMAATQASLDIQTGGGEILAGVPAVPPVAAATESYPPNLVKASENLLPKGILVVADQDEPPLPFADATFDLVTSRHPATIWWAEIARVLAPGGTYLAQHVGPTSAFELIEFFLGPQLQARKARDPEVEIAQAKEAGLEIVDLQTARLRIELYDAAAAIYLLRKVIWWVPGFTVEKYRDRLWDLHKQIQSDGVFVAHSTRHLIEARRQ